MRKEFKITEEMRNNQDFNFAVYVYENVRDAGLVHEESLEFLDEKRNLTNSIESAVYFTMRYDEEGEEEEEEEEEEIEYIIY